MDLNGYAALEAWYLRIAERPAAVMGYDVPKATPSTSVP